MAKTKMGVVGCGGRMGRMLVAEIAATEGCAVAGGSEAPGSGYVNQDIGELAGIGRIGIPIGEAVEKLMRSSDVVLEFTSPGATAEHAELAASLDTAMVIGTTWELFGLPPIVNSTALKRFRLRMLLRDCSILRWSKGWPGWYANSRRTMRWLTLRVPVTVVWPKIAWALGSTRYHT